MKINLNTDTLREKLGLATHFTSSRLGSIAALQGVLLVGEKNILHIYSTNLSTHFHTCLKVENIDKLKTIVDAKKIIEFLSLLPSGKIEMEITDKAIVFHQEKTKGTFPLMKLEDFPLPPEMKGEEEKISAAVLKKNLPFVLFTAAKDETRPVLSGVNFLNIDEQTYMVATDGFRLSLMKTKKIKGLPSMLVPAEFLSEIVRQVAEDKEIIFGFSPEEKTVVFRIGENDFYSRLIEGEFPPFEKVIPTETVTQVVLDKDELLRSVKLVSVFARDYSNIVVCEFNKNELRLRPKTEAGEENSTALEIELKGEPQKVAFNYKFLLDFLNNTDDKKIRVEILRSDAPVVFKKEENLDFLHIIMPVRIQE
jgi:DNA polymerase III subunit beta